jgi:hypothetical protein
MYITPFRTGAKIFLTWVAIELHCITKHDISQPQQTKQMTTTASVNLALIKGLVGLRDKTQNPLCSMCPITHIVSILSEFSVFRIGVYERLVFLGHDLESLGI